MNGWATTTPARPSGASVALAPIPLRLGAPHGIRMNRTSGRAATTSTSATDTANEPREGNPMSDHANFSDLPPVTELAERVRAGETIAALARELNVAPVTLYNRFQYAGFAPTGETRKVEAQRELKEYLAGVLRTWSEPWMSEGICGQTDPESWFPEKGSSTADAKSVCMGCPVRARCLEYALRNREKFGVWGGKSERERRRIAKEREVAA